MVVRIESKPSFAVIGKLGQGAAAGSAPWISLLWREANLHFPDIHTLLKTDQEGKPLRLWGAMSDLSETFARWTDQGKYLAGCEVWDDAVAPAGWTKWVIPSCKFAVIACIPDTYGDIFDYMVHEYLPGRGHSIVGAVHECHDLAYVAGSLELYFPIEKLSG